MDKFSREWFVIYSNPQREEQARFHLSLKGLQTFFPRLQIPVAGENKSRITPLFRNYLFACIDVATERHLVVWTPGVRKIVSCGDEPVPIEESVVRFLQRQALTVLHQPAQTCMKPVWPPVGWTRPDSFLAENSGGSPNTWAAPARNPREIIFHS